MRPTYETDADIAKEAEVAKVAAEKWNCEMFKLAKFGQFDFAAIRSGQIKAFVEIRCRSNRSDAYPTMIVSANKVIAAWQTEMATGIPAFFVVRWTDQIGFINLAQRFAVTIGGRVDRGDKADIEAVCHIPIDQFQMIATVGAGP